MQCQVAKAFAEENLLKLNVSKSEVVLFSSQKGIAFQVCEMEGSLMPARDVGKCLNYWWRETYRHLRGDLSELSRTSGKAVMFFHFGSIGMFQNDVSPLSSRAVLESCVMPVLLFGCENWILSETLWQKLEAFQGKLVK